MFDVGFSEILLIAVLALVVLGPDKLPEMGRKLGDFFRAFQQTKRDMHASIFSSSAPDKTPPNDNNTNKKL